MNIDWELLWEIGLCVYGVYLVLFRPKTGVGIEGFQPSFYLKGRNVMYLGIACIVLSYVLFINDWW